VDIFSQKVCQSCGQYVWGDEPTIQRVLGISVNVEYTRLQKFAYRWLPGLIRYYRFRLFLDVSPTNCFQPCFSPVDSLRCTTQRNQHNKRWTARNYVDGKGHDQLEDQLLDYLAKNAPPEYLDALTPRYREYLDKGRHRKRQADVESAVRPALGCKRPAFDQGWLASLHKPNVHLTSSPIERITADGIVTKDGVETPVDIIVFATGSDVARHGVGLNVGLYGEDGLELRSYWESLDGPEAYFGLAVPKVSRTQCKSSCETLADDADDCVDRSSQTTSWCLDRTP
jgi:hypothetical protein